jgi:hypothetical protein
MLALYVVSLRQRIRERAIFWFDFLFPSAVVFFFFFPDFGGHQYGPRYWFFGWPTMALTVGAALNRSSWLPLKGQRLDIPTVAVLQCASYLGVSIISAIWLRIYFDERRAVFDAIPPKVPALVLVPSSPIGISGDFARNDFLYRNAVLYGRGDTQADFKRACEFDGRAVYIWSQRTSSLRELHCGDPSSYWLQRSIPASQAD